MIRSVVIAEFRIQRSAIVGDDEADRQYIAGRQECDAGVTVAGSQHDKTPLRKSHRQPTRFSGTNRGG
ncbi:hypothetical protein [Burkholderia contaminans]|uniref:hypothetical protein n=1 Tax=Burkholderia contaminans TaxID=488447 RepID=UPI000F5B50EF|nr:hypothetical protein [Burkholderia contaminans]